MTGLPNARKAYCFKPSLVDGVAIISSNFYYL
jgi:hypothetical protein